MPSFNRRSFISVLALLGVFPSSILGATGRPIRCRVETTLPRATKLANGERIGYNIELIRAICAGTQREAMFEDYVWQKALKLAEMGELDLLSGVTYKASRARYLEYLVPNEIEQRVLLVNKSMVTSPINTLDDLSRLPKPVQLTYQIAYPDALETRLANDKDFAKHFITVTTRVKAGQQLSLRDTVARLINKRISAAPILSNQAYQMFSGQSELFSEFPLEQLGIVRSPIFPPSENYIALSKAGLPKETRSALRASFLRIRESDEFINMWQKWFKDAPMPHTQTPPPY